MPNGIRVVTEKIPYVKSITIGIWINAGSRQEDVNNHGVSHFIEHLMFKGTEKRSAKDIAEEIDAVGGQLNAFTAKECTCYYIKILDTHLDLAIDILSDMLLSSQFADEDIDKEKQVVLEEYNMYEDTPDELIHDLYVENVWSKNSLGRTILGTKETITGFNKNIVKDYYNQFYNPDNIVIAAAGNLEHQVLVELVEKYFNKLRGKTAVNPAKSPNFSPVREIIAKDIEQVHICLGTEGVAQAADNLFAAHVLNNLLGGSVSSRLFQSIREDRGLAYSIYSYPTSYSNAGLFTIYTATRPTNAAVVMELIWSTIEQTKNTITQNELTKTKEQLKGSLLLGLESSSSRMNRLGKLEVTLNKYVTLDEVVAKIERVTLNDVQELANRLFIKENFGIVALGPLQDKDISI